MAYRPVKARDVAPGDVLAPTLDAGVFSVRAVELSPAPGTMSGLEAAIRGPLGIVVKRDADAIVRLLN